MKRKIAMVLVGLMCISATGCNMFKNKGIDIDVLKTEDIFTEVAEESVVDSNTAAEEFTNALTASTESDNITVNVANSIAMGTEGEESYQYSLNDTTVKFAKEGETKVGSVNIDNTYKYGNTGKNGAPEEEKNKVTGYYSGDALYFITNEGDKVREEMAYEDFLSVVNNYTLGLYNDCISKAACVEGKNSKTYYISYDPAKFETTMNTNMEASGQTFADGEAMDVKYANIIAEVDNEGNMMGYGFIINAEYINDNQNIPYDYVIKTTFSDKDKTNVDVVTDTDSYMSADEYTELMQERAASEAESISDSETEATENGSQAETEAAE